MRYLLLILSFVYTPVSSAQNIEVSSSGASAQNNQSTFSFDQSVLQLQNGDLMVSGVDDPLIVPAVYTFDISSQGRFLGVIHGGEDGLRATMIDGRGRRITAAELDLFNPSDETLGMRVFNDGRFITRDNVVQFTFFESDGSTNFSISNSSGSTGGESVSEMVADPAGRTVLLYNPRINYGTGQGSRARIVRSENDLNEIYASRERTIKSATISESGSFITLITEGGQSDEVLVFDRFGNEIIRLESGEELSGASLTGEAAFLTLFSSSRIQVYSVADMERLGSASFRANVVYATYSGHDSQILALSGTVGGLNGSSRLSNPEIHAVHLEKRSIARTEIEVPVSYLNHDRLNLNRTGANRFLLTGLNRDLTIRTLF